MRILGEQQEKVNAQKEKAAAKKKERKDAAAAGKMRERKPARIKRESAGIVAKDEQVGAAKDGEGRQVGARRLQGITGASGVDVQEMGNLPWERQGVFQDLIEESGRRRALRGYETAARRGRRTLDTFADSLRFVNKLYSRHYGYEARKVPAHMPHMIDVAVMDALHARFPAEWDETSRHRIRSPNDMQFSFSYFYFLMSEKQTMTTEELFAMFDTDKTSTWSDREIRTLATRVHDAPLTLDAMMHLEATIVNCSRHLTAELQREQSEVTTPYYERYYDSKLPTVTKNLILTCKPVIDLIRKTIKPESKYKHEVVGEEDVSFKMISTNVSTVVGQLDDLRRHPKKFICLNDNIDHGREEATTVKALLHDFYETMLPLQCQFELPLDYRNRFLHMAELRSWRIYRDILKAITYLCLFLLVCFSAASFCSQQISAVSRRVWRTRRESGSPGDGSRMNV